MRTLCLDFDGVVHSYTKGARVVPDPPVPGALELMHAMLNAGFDIAINSSRSGHWGGRQAMRQWLRKHAGNQWPEVMGMRGLEEVRFPRHKPAAFLTLDDRAWTFRGEWPTAAEVAAFRPWRALAPGLRSRDADGS